LCKYPSLVPGERGILLIVAPDTKQASIVLDYVTAVFEGSPILNQLVVGRTGRELNLNNNISIEVRASDFRTIRGSTFIAAVLDELAFFMV
jgi:phage terminase large subunit-like protein